MPQRVVADVETNKIGVNVLGTSEGDHSGGEIDSGDSAGGHPGSQVGGGFSGTAADLQERLSGLEGEEVGVLGESGGHGLGGGVLLIPAGGQGVKEGDPGVGGGHTSVLLRNTQSRHIIFQIVIPTGYSSSLPGELVNGQP